MKIDHKTKTQLLFFFSIAFGFNALMAIPLYLAKKNGIALDVYPILMMYLPATGVMVGALFTRRQDSNLPKFFYGIYLINVVILILLALLPLFIGDLPTTTIANASIGFCSILSWILLLTREKVKKKIYGLGLGNWKRILIPILIFFLIYFFRGGLGYLLEGSLEEVSQLFTLQKFFVFLLLPLNFFFAFLPFLGEEYGWRYFLQPILQKKYGMIQGVLILGFLWGIWHLPANLFYYSARGMEIRSIINQIGNCLTLSIFFSYAYAKSRSIWAPILLHFFNNNWVILFVEDLNKMDKILENQAYSWSGILFISLFGLVFFGAFAFSKYAKKKEYRMETMNEMADKYFLKSEKYNQEILEK